MTTTIGPAYYRGNAQPIALDDDFTKIAKMNGHLQVRELTKIKAGDKVTGISAIDFDTITSKVKAIGIKLALNQDNNILFRPGTPYASSQGQQTNVRVDVQNDVHIVDHMPVEKSKPKKNRYTETSKKGGKAVKGKKKQATPTTSVVSQPTRGQAAHVLLAYQEGRRVSAQIAVPKGRAFSVEEIAMALYKSAVKHEVYEIV